MLFGLSQNDALQREHDRIWQGQYNHSNIGKYEHYEIPDSRFEDDCLLYILKYKY